MNQSYQTNYSAAIGAWVAVSETVLSHGRGSRKAVLAFSVLACTINAQAANECGSTGGPGVTITCTGGSYANGINYYKPALTPVSPGILVLNNASIVVTGVGVLVGNQKFVKANVTVQADQFKSINTTADGLNGRGIMVTTNGNATVNVTGGSISTSGAYDSAASNGAIGVLAEVMGSPLSGKGAAVVTLNGSGVSTTGEYAYGVMAKSGIAGNAYERASIDIVDSLIHTTGLKAYGLRSALTTVGNTRDSTIAVRGNSTVKTEGPGAHSVFAQSQDGASQVLVNSGAQITASGSEANAVHAFSNSSGSVVVDNAGILISNTADGINASGGNGGTSIVNTGTITGATNGIFASNVGTGATSITTAGLVTATNNSGMHSETYSSVSNSSSNGMTLTTTTISSVVPATAIVTYTSAGNSVAINLQGGANVFSAGGVAIRDLGGNAVVTMDSGSKLAGKVLLGNGSDAMVVKGIADISGATLIDGGNSVYGKTQTTTVETYNNLTGQWTTTSTSIPVAETIDVLGSADGNTNTFTFQNATQSLAGSILVNWDTVNLDASQVTLTDGTLVTSNEIGNGLYLKNKSTLISPVALAITGNVNIDATSSLYHVQGGSITGDVTNAGLIYWQNLGKTLTINGNYNGVSGARLSLETYLADDSSTTDKLHVTGNTSGTTAITVRPISGSPGAQTVNGIRVVQVDGSSAANSFTLAGPVQAGAYQYLLKQGSAIDGNDWYLSSTYDCQVGGNCPTSSAGSTTSPNSPPIYRPGVANYVGGQSINAEQGLLQLSTYHQRLGEQRAVDGEGHNTWLRPYFSRQTADGKARIDYDTRIAGMQFGQEVWQDRGEGNRARRAAVTLDYARSDADISDAYRSLGRLDTDTGRLDAASLALGGTFAWTDGAGGYVDLVGQISALRNHYSDRYGDKSLQKGWRSALSVEAGKPVARLGEWQIEPQTQFIYMHTRYKDFDDPTSHVEGYSAELLRGRIGARVFTDTASSGEPGTHLYGLVNFLHDFMTPDGVRVGNTRVEERYSRTRAELGAGFQQRWRKDAQAYADVRYQHSLDADQAHGLQVNVGVRIAF